MAVLFKKNGERSEMVVTCRCGCDDAAHITINHDDDDWHSIISYMNGSFYADQNKSICGVIRDKLKRIWAIIRNKDYYYSDVLMNKEEWEQFKAFINEEI